MDKSVYSRPNKPTRITVRRRRVGVPRGALPALPDLITVDKTTECHVTPPEVAARMVSYLGPVGDYLTLEPSAGTGNLIDALYAVGHCASELVAIERHVDLCAAIRRRFTDDLAIDPINECFIDYAQRAHQQIEYPRIIMNPPFRAVKQHISAALSLLGKGGHDVATLVALVPSTFEHDDAETVEVLSNETFSAAKVHTQIIRIRQ